jgi:hypothetical protein
MSRCCGCHRPPIAADVPQLSFTHRAAHAASQHPSVRVHFPPTLQCATLGPHAHPPGRHRPVRRFWQSWPPGPLAASLPLRSQTTLYSLLLPAASCCLRVPAIGGCPEGQAYSPAIQVPNATFSAQSTAQSVWISSRPPSSISQARGGAPGRSQKTQENHALSASYWHLRMVQYSARTDVPPTRGGVRGFLSVCTSLGVWPNPRRSSLTTAPCRAAGGGGAGPYDVSMCGSPE